MKHFIIIIPIILLFSACSDKTAFSKFNMSKKQELSANSIQSSRIMLNNNILGVVSVLYLNDIYPKIYNKNEYFYIYYYLKNPQKVDFILNNKKAIKIIKLKPLNQFSKLVSSSNKWNQHYLVEFSKEGNSLNLLLKSAEASSHTFRYHKHDL